MQCRDYEVSTFPSFEVIFTVGKKIRGKEEKEKVLKESKERRFLANFLLVQRNFLRRSLFNAAGPTAIFFFFLLLVK